MIESSGSARATQPTQFCVGDMVIVFAASEREASGRIVEDFGEFSPLAVQVNNMRIADPARRYAVALTDGGLVFADEGDLSRLGFQQ